MIVRLILCDGILKINGDGSDIVFEYRSGHTDTPAFGCLYCYMTNKLVNNQGMCIFTHFSLAIYIIDPLFPRTMESTFWTFLHDPNIFTKKIFTYFSVNFKLIFLLVCSLYTCLNSGIGDDGTTREGSSPILISFCCPK